MAKIIYNKLVRDDVPDIIEADGHRAVYDTIEDKDEMLVALLLKLVEEVAELDEALTEATQEDDEAVVRDVAVIEELADVLTVFTELIDELSRCHEPIADAVLKQIQTKTSEKGTFSKRVFLREVIEKESV
jgi:predicted house-cleaning noncanonical NTP pyrophosphatase (MazG superfamily)